MEYQRAGAGAKRLGLVRAATRRWTGRHVLSAAPPRDGSVDPFSKGMLVEADGSARVLRWNEVDLQPLGAWTSPRTGDRYPAGWRLRVPTEKLDLTVTPKSPTRNAANGTVLGRAVAVHGHALVIENFKVRGYLEMTRFEPI